MASRKKENVRPPAALQRGKLWVIKKRGRGGEEVTDETPNWRFQWEKEIAAREALKGNSSIIWTQKTIYKALEEASTA